LNDGCEELPTDLCVELGGEPLGPGSECQEPRPCCFVGDVSALCVDMDPRCCENSGGIPQSENLECTEPVACCLGQACFMVDRVCCDELGGVSHGPGSNCENNPCDPQECGPTTDGLGCQNVVCPDPNEECVPTVAHCDPTGLFCQVVECECQDPDLCHVQTHDVPVGFDCGGVCPPGFECFERIEGIPNGIQVSCDCVPGEPEGCCFPGGGCANLPPGFCELEGGVPLGPGTNCAVAGICTEPPRIVHETGPNARTRPCTGYIDPRIESTNGADLNAGLQIADILFTVPVFGTPAGGAVTPANFAMSEQCLGATPPTITSVSPIAANLRHWRVEWDRPLTLQEYTTLRATVFNAIGIPIINVGNLGPGMSEPDRVDYGFLPADADNNETVQPLDLLRMRQKLSGTCPPAPTCPDCGGERLYFDIDRNGAIQALDLLRWRQLWFGTGPATQPWQAESMLCNQP
jgi:hypothetical protein